MKTLDATDFRMGDKFTFLNYPVIMHYAYPGRAYAFMSKTESNIRFTVDNVDTFNLLLRDGSIKPGWGQSKKEEEAYLLNNTTIEALKKDFSGSDDYLSGVNDGLYKAMRHLMDMHKGLDNFIEFLNINPKLL